MSVTIRPIHRIPESVLQDLSNPDHSQWVNELTAGLRFSRKNFVERSLILGSYSHRSSNQTDGYSSFKRDQALGTCLV